jgi:hypothetical protein
MNLSLLLLVAGLASPTLSEPSPDIEAARAYASCLGLTAVLRSASIQRIDDAIAEAFAECAAQRKAARDAIATVFRTGGLSDDRAAGEAEQTLRENDQMMSDKLKADIATFRRTGHPPADALD